MNGVRGIIANLYNLILFHKDKLGKWTTFTISNNIKIVLVIIMYRILNSNNRGSSTSIAQYNTIEARIKNATRYRK